MPSCRAVAFQKTAFGFHRQIGIARQNARLNFRVERRVSVHALRFGGFPLIALRGGERTAERGADFQNRFVNHVAAVARAARGDFEFVFKDRGNFFALLIKRVLRRQIVEHRLHLGELRCQFRAILRVNFRLLLFPDRRELVDERLRLVGELLGFAKFQRNDQFAIGDAVRVFARNQGDATREQPLHPANVRRGQKIRQTGFHVSRQAATESIFCFSSAESFHATVAVGAVKLLVSPAVFTNAVGKSASVRISFSFASITFLSAALIATCCCKKSKSCRTRIVCHSRYSLASA